MKILFIVPYPLNESPSQRFRFEQYFRILEARGHNFIVQSFLDSHNWQIFFDAGNFWPKLAGIIRGILKRVSILFSITQFDFVFIHREAAPLGPPVFEWVIASVFGKKIIYDFDDAIWLTDRKNESFFLRIVKWRGKVSQICRLSYRVSGGNAYICEFARKFNARVVLNPTTIDTESLHNPEKHKKTGTRNSLVVGWTGSHSTLKYLEGFEPMLQRIESSFPNIAIMVIADRPPAMNLKSVRFKRWTIDSEAEDLSELDIGIMPLPDDEWSKGKCGFKALQYMAMGIPTIASPVGVNSKIIRHGENGYLASSQAEWLHFLTLLISDTELRKKIGEKGRQTVIQEYSVRSNAENFLSLFEHDDK
jgi:glycosyltransferase involved in cell wall biosynthesis